MSMSNSVLEKIHERKEREKGREERKTGRERECGRERLERYSIYEAENLFALLWFALNPGIISPILTVIFQLHCNYNIFSLDCSLGTIRLESLLV